eukprot:121294-Chlamydomonas_euryale.AAC.11
MTVVWGFRRHGQPDPHIPHLPATLFCSGSARTVTSLCASTSGPTWCGGSSSTPHLSSEAASSCGRRATLRLRPRRRRTRRFVVQCVMEVWGRVGVSASSCGRRATQRLRPRIWRMWRFVMQCVVDVWGRVGMRASFCGGRVTTRLRPRRWTKKCEESGSVGLASVNNTRSLAGDPLRVSNERVHGSRQVSGRVRFESREVSGSQEGFVLDPGSPPGFLWPGRVERVRMVRGGVCCVAHKCGPQPLIACICTTTSAPFPKFVFLVEPKLVETKLVEPMLVEP